MTAMRWARRACSSCSSARRALLARGAFQSPQEALRLLSKEIEYAQENVDRLADFPL